MKVGYRRYSGKAFLSGDKVTSTRGAWLEKRIAFVELLKSRGHEVTVVKTGEPMQSFDVLFVEFGSDNAVFYGDDIEYTKKLIEAEQGKIIFICDDPELFPKLNPFYIDHYWVNAENELACSKHFGVPCESFPFYGLQETQSFASEHNEKVVYYGGTSQGREERLSKYRVFLPLEVYGKQKDFKDINPLPPPSQEERASFYRKFKYCLGMTDNKHRKLGWNTGRIYHAIAAGVPVLHEDKWIEELKMDRQTLWQLQISLFQTAYIRCIAKLEQIGL